MTTDHSPTVLIPLVNRILNDVPFNNIIGMQVTEIAENQASIRFDMRPELIGNPIQGILHGGVIASVLDMVGGVVVMVNLFVRNIHMAEEERNAKLAKTSTVDLHVAYLRPGRGEHFIAQAELLRSGSKIAVAQVKLLNHEQLIIAIANVTYSIG